MNQLYVCDWFLANELFLISKIETCDVHPHQRKFAFNFNLKIFDNKRNVFKHLETKNFVKYLRVLVNNYFTSARLIYEMIDSQ